MKKMYLGLIGLGCGALLLTGCGGNAHTLKCTQKSDGSDITMTVYYNDDETKAKSVKAESIYDGSSLSDEDFKEGKEELEKMCDSSPYKSCKITTSGKKVIMTIEANPEDLGYDGQSLKAAKENAKNAGYKCE